MNFGFTYAIILFLLFIIGTTILREHTKTFLIISDFLIALPAYTVRPANFIYFDTVRFENILNQMRGINNLSGISAGLNWGLNSSEYANQPLVVLYLWLFSFFKSNGMLFFLTTLVFLLFLTFFLIDIQKYFRLKSIDIIKTQFIILVTFNLFFQIEGIRNFLSFMIFSWAIFNDLVIHKKTGPLFAYLFCAFFHPIVFVFILLRGLLFLRELKILNNLIFDCIIIFFCLTYNFFSSAIISILSMFENSPFANMLVLKSQSYLYGQSNFSAFSGREEFLITSLIFLTLIAEYVIFNLMVERNIALGQYLKLYTYIIAFTIGSFFNVQIYLRTIVLILFLSAPIKSILFSSYIELKNRYLLWLYKFLIVITAFIAFSYWYIAVYRNVLVF